MSVMPSPRPFLGVLVLVVLILPETLVGGRREGDKQAAGASDAAPDVRTALPAVIIFGDSLSDTGMPLRMTQLCGWMRRSDLHNERLCVRTGCILAN